MSYKEKLLADFFCLCWGMKLIGFYKSGTVLICIVYHYGCGELRTCQIIMWRKTRETDIRKCFGHIQQEKSWEWVLLWFIVGQKSEIPMTYLSVENSGVCSIMPWLFNSSCLVGRRWGKKTSIFPDISWVWQFTTWAVYTWNCTLHFAAACWSSFNVVNFSSPGIFLLVLGQHHDLSM